MIQILHPVAVVIVFGLFSSTLLDLTILQSKMDAIGKAWRKIRPSA